MTKIQQDLSIVRGTDETITVTVTDDADAPVNLTGSTPTWKMAARPYGGVVVSKTLGSGLTLTDAANGVMSIDLDAADTATLFGLYWHQVEVLDGSGNKSVVTTGAIMLHLRMP